MAFPRFPTYISTDTDMFEETKYQITQFRNFALSGPFWDYEEAATNIVHALTDGVNIYISSSTNYTEIDVSDMYFEGSGEIEDFENYSEIEDPESFEISGDYMDKAFNNMPVTPEKAVNSFLFGLQNYTEKTLRYMYLETFLETEDSITNYTNNLETLKNSTPVPPIYINSYDKTKSFTPVIKSYTDIPELVTILKEESLIPVISPVFTKFFKSLTTGSEKEFSAINNETSNEIPYEVETVSPYINNNTDTADIATVNTEIFTESVESTTTEYFELSYDDISLQDNGSDIINEHKLVSDNVKGLINSFNNFFGNIFMVPRNTTQKRKVHIAPDFNITDAVNYTEILNDEEIRTVDFFEDIDEHFGDSIRSLENVKTELEKAFGDINKEIYGERYFDLYDSYRKNLKKDENFSKDTKNGASSFNFSRRSRDLRDSLNTIIKKYFTTAISLLFLSLIGYPKLYFILDVI
ncbi:hypothetical protein CDIK_2851 [Cucumispora dikerogammari]|nr:hypothetical protein CDIK_2851 [Cucumispora dikerogammari]